MPAEVRALELAMEELLALLADPESAGVEQAWRRCQAAERDLNLLTEDPSGLSADEVDELRDGLEILVRLNAIACQALLHRQESLAKGLARTKLETAKVRAYGGATVSLGGSCNLAG